MMKLHTDRGGITEERELSDETKLFYEPLHSIGKIAFIYETGVQVNGHNIRHVQVLGTQTDYTVKEEDGVFVTHVSLTGIKPEDKKIISAALKWCGYSSDIRF